MKVPQKEKRRRNLLFSCGKENLLNFTKKISDRYDCEGSTDKMKSVRLVLIFCPVKEKILCIVVLCGGFVDAGRVEEMR